MDTQVIKIEGEAFHTFELSIKLSDKHQLTLTMKDFVNWAIYEKKYSDDDIGGEINRKMELADVYNAFAQTKAERQKEGTKFRHQENQNQLKVVIENGSEELPCYKIERTGRVTVYLNILDRGANKQVTYESILILNKVRDMTETEIRAEKSKNEKEQPKKEIQKQKIEREELMKRVAKLEEENERVRQELGAIRKGVTYEQLHAKIKSVREEQAEINLKFDEELESVAEELEQILDKLADQNPQGRCANQMVLYNPMATLMNLPQAYSHQFKVDGLKLKYIGDDWNWTQYIFNYPINHNQTFNFRIKIVKIQGRRIMIGVVDYAKQKDKRISFDSGNAMCYLGWNGNKWPEKVREGDGFYEGDIVEVRVNRPACTIKYIVNGGVPKAAHKNQMLADSSRVFMPYVEMADTNGCVEWL